jgi:hypothetical protein
MYWGNSSDAGRARAKSSDVHSGLSSSGRDIRSSIFFAIRIEGILRQKGSYRAALLAKGRINVGPAITI